MTIKELISFLQKDIDLNPHMADRPILDGMTYSEITGLGIGQMGVCLTTQFYGFKHTEDSKWEFFEKIFNLAQVKILDHWEIPNGYWPDSYLNTKATNPWWLVQTELGMVRIGWRKRVIEICWENTPLRIIITEDDVTKDLTYVHAWGEEKAVEYLRTFNTYSPSISGPDNLIAKSLLSIAEKTQIELQGMAEFVEKHLNATWK